MPDLTGGVYVNQTAAFSWTSTGRAATRRRTPRYPSAGWWADRLPGGGGAALDLIRRTGPGPRVRGVIRRTPLAPCEGLQMKTVMATLTSPGCSWRPGGA